MHIITDHKALEFFKTQCNLSNRQHRWMDYMSKFDFDITYIKGEFNKGADCLSRYYESDTNADIHEFHEYVQADRRIVPDGEDLPNARRQEIKERVIEIRSMHAIEIRRTRRLQEAQEHYEAEAAEMEWATIDQHNASLESGQSDVNEENSMLGDSLGVEHVICLT